MQSPFPLSKLIAEVQSEDRAKLVGELGEDAADTAPGWIAATPGHAGAKRHDAANLAGPLNQAHPRALPRRAERGTEPGGSPADHQNIG